MAAQTEAPSGRVHSYVGISLDGFIASPDGGVDWLNPYADARAGFQPFIKTIGSTIMGRATLAELVRQIRERHPRDIWLMGGGILTKSLAEADLTTSGSWRSSPPSSAPASPCFRRPRSVSAASGRRARTQTRAASSGFATNAGENGLRV